MQRKHERLIAFLWFCVRMEWITKNPAILLKRVKAEPTPTDYFPKEEFKVLVDATYAYGDRAAATTSSTAATGSAL